MKYSICYYNKILSTFHDEIDNTILNFSIVIIFAVCFLYVQYHLAYRAEILLFWFMLSNHLCKRFSFVFDLSANKVFHWEAY